jgi:ubiquitin C-terminal hydrolase
LVHSSAAERRRGALSLENLFGILRRKSRIFTGHTQEDVHEAMARLLDYMLSEERTSAEQRSVSTDTVLSSEFDIVQGPCVSWRLFGSQTSSQVHCSECSARGTERRENSLSVGLSLPESAVRISLADVLSSEFLVSSEYMSDARCGECGRSGVEKVTRAVTAPLVMCILLKRYKTAFRDGKVCVTKVTSEVEVPAFLCSDVLGWAHNQTLVEGALQKDAAGSSNEDLSKLTEQYRTPFNIGYLLHAVVCHLGSSTSSGHYVAYVRRRGLLPGSLKSQDQWYMCNDETVRPVEEARVLRDAGTMGYVLMYRMVDPCTIQL